MVGPNYLGTIKILSASLFAVVLIVGAYTVARDAESPATAQASSEAELLKQIAARDTDVDGLRDWEEALYGTDPRVADTKKLGMTDGEAVAKGLIVPTAPTAVRIASSTPSTFDPAIPTPERGTLTRALSESLITAYGRAVAQSPNGELSAAAMQQITDQLIEELNASVSVTPNFKQSSDLRMTGSTEAEMRAFAVSVEALFLAHTAVIRKNEVASLEAALQKGDLEAYNDILATAKLYEQAALGLAVVPVPDKLAGDDLMLINAFARLSKIIEDFARAESDPIATMLALKQYPDAVQQLGTALARISTTYRTSNILFVEGAPGARFVHIMDRVIEGLKASQSTQP